MISYADIQKANETLHFTDVKGKNYAEVPQRVKAFRMLYPQGFIITDMISNDGGVCVFKATAGYYGDNGEAYTLGTGTAYEKEGSSFINKTSYIENCETSAVGRALGFLNIGSDSSIASYEEVQNAKLQQGEELPADALKPGEKVKFEKKSWDARAAIKTFCDRHNINGEKFQQLRRSLIEGGIAKNIKYDDLDPIEFDVLCKAMESNYADMLGMKQ